MDRNEFTLEAVVEENVALKAQVESLEIRLAAAKDQVASLQQFIEERQPCAERVKRRLKMQPSR